MQLKTILNRVEHFKSFVYGKAKWVEDGEGPKIEVAIEARKNGRPICSGCGRPAPGYDRLPERRFEFVPLWGIAVLFVYAMRRVQCPACGVKVEQVPWCDGKNRLTTSYRWFLASWAKRISWRGVACAFGTSWQNVYRSVKHVVSWGLAHRDLEGIEAIGVDEIQWQRGHKYLKVIAKKAGQAVHVLDRFHIMAKMNKAIDEVRAAEAKRLERDGYEPVLKHSRWCLLKREENLTEKQAVKLSELLQYNLQSVRSRLMRECLEPLGIGILRRPGLV